MLIIGATFYPNWLTTMSPVSRRIASARSSTPIIGATFCPNWLTTTRDQPCCQQRRVTRESGYDRGGNLQQRSETREETVQGYGWELTSLVKTQLWLMTEPLFR
ncbi:hypothetical protein LINPERPRIM_LOCUS26924 [Linum perenne]